MMAQENSEDESDSLDSDDDSDSELLKKSGEHSKDPCEKNRSLNNAKEPCEKNRSLNISKGPCEKNRSLNNTEESFFEFEDPEEEIMRDYFKDQCEKNRYLNNSKDPCEKNRSLIISKDPRENNPEDSKCTLEKAFDKLRNRDTLDKEEEKALIYFADRFVTCTLNPDIASKMVSKDTDISKGRRIVKIAKETQTHHHTKTCKKTSPDCRFGMPRYPMWKTILSKPVKGTD